MLLVPSFRSSLRFTPSKYRINGFVAEDSFMVTRPLQTARNSGRFYLLQHVD
jgi:hypothetical protein